MVKLLALLGDSLGREEACRLLGPTLQCFFASFSGVHQSYSRPSAEAQNYSRPSAEAKNYSRPLAVAPSYNRPSAEDQRYNGPSAEALSYTRPSAEDLSYTRPSAEDLSYTRPSAEAMMTSTSATVIDEGVKADTLVWTAHTDTLSSSLKHQRERKKSVEFHSHLADDKDKMRKHEEDEESSSTGTGPHTNNGDSIPDSEYYRQLCATFSKAMAYSSYITFCRLLGQYYLQDCLCNADLVEQLAYSHDEVAQPASPLASIGLDVDITSDSSGSEEDDDYDDEEVDVTMARDAALKVGPIVAVTGLNMEESGFRKSSWFVELEEQETEEAMDVSVCVCVCMCK